MWTAAEVIGVRQGASCLLANIQTQTERLSWGSNSRLCGWRYETVVKSSVDACVEAETWVEVSSSSSQRIGLLPSGWFPYLRVSHRQTWMFSVSFLSSFKKTHTLLFFMLLRTQLEVLNSWMVVIIKLVYKIPCISPPVIVWVNLICRRSERAGLWRPCLEPPFISGGCLASGFENLDQNVRNYECSRFSIHWRIPSGCVVVIGFHFDSSKTKTGSKARS